uniref:Ribonuclease P protein subunit p21 n=1 Tax=Mesocestoides corti TaxID=53468 RepID=A0A5K3ETV2_MESCO
ISVREEYDLYLCSEIRLFWWFLSLVCEGYLVVTPVHQQINILYRQAHGCIYPLINARGEAEREVSYLACRRCIKQLLYLAKKSRVRLSPVMRRSICRGCHLILDSRTTCRLRLHKMGLVLICEGCGTRNKLPFQRNSSYQPAFFERMLPDSVLPTVDTSENQSS